jgi:hypothetical protein
MFTLNFIQTWCAQNGLSISPGKTQVLNLHRKLMPQINFLNQTIEQSKQNLQELLQESPLVHETIRQVIC